MSEEKEKVSQNSQANSASLGELYKHRSGAQSGVRSADLECLQCGKWIGEKPCKCDPAEMKE